MINKIEIENFLSVRDRQTLELIVPGNAPKETDRLASCWPSSKERVPKVVAIFGANGSGKSNVLRALSFIIWFVRDSFSVKPEERLPYRTFNALEAEKSPTRLKIWMSGPENLIGQDDSNSPWCHYSYEIIISNPDQRVMSEAIFYWPRRTGRKTRLIERFEDGSIKAAQSFGLASDRKVLEKVLRPNASVISTLAQLNHQIATRIVESAGTVRTNILFERFELSDQLALRQYVDDPFLVENFNKEISRIDVGVRTLNVETTNEGPVVNFTHSGLDRPMPFVLESHGTRQFIKLFPMIFDTLNSGGIVIVDELDVAIHPMVMSELLRWFYDADRNKHNSQLWMSCHSVNLLEDLSKDEIVFCEKDMQGRTEIYSLNDVGAVRRDDNFYRKYLGGAFGAVPRFG